LTQTKTGVSEKCYVPDPTQKVGKEPVGVVLNRCKPAIVEDWLSRAKLIPELARVNLPDNERTEHLSKILDEIVARLSKNLPSFREENALISDAAANHGKARKLQGYTAAMLVHESRVLQVTLFETLSKNKGDLDFNLVMTDIMRIADEVDSQLAQSMESFMASMPNEAVA